MFNKRHWSELRDSLVGRSGNSVEIGSGVCGWLLAVVLVGSTLDYSTASNLVHVLVTVPTVGALGVFGVYLRPKLEIPRYALVGYLAIWLIYLPHAIVPTVNTWALVRIPVFMGGLFVLLFVVPRTVSLQRFLSTVFYVVALICIVGLPTVVIGRYEVFGRVISAYLTMYETPIWGIKIYPLESLFDNPNPLGVVSAMGFAAGLGVVDRRRDVLHVALLAAVGLSLYLTLSRGAYVAAFVAVAVYGTYRRFGRRGVFVLMTAGGILASYFFAALFGLVPDIVGVQTQFKYGRLTFWSRAFAALRDAPLFGIGFQRLADEIGVYNTHSGYVYVLLTRGFVGGIVHFAFLSLVVQQRLNSLRDERTAALLAMLVVVLTLMVFDSLILFGFSSHTVWSALIVGYSLQPEL